jgi:hypothetical protein
MLPISVLLVELCLLVYVAPAFTFRFHRVDLFLLVSFPLQITSDQKTSQYQILYDMSAVPTGYKTVRLMHYDPIEKILISAGVAITKEQKDSSSHRPYSLSYLRVDFGTRVDTTPKFVCFMSCPCLYRFILSSLAPSGNSGVCSSAIQPAYVLVPASFARIQRPLNQYPSFAHFAQRNHVAADFTFLPSYVPDDQRQLR